MVSYHGASRVRARFSFCGGFRDKRSPDARWLLDPAVPALLSLLFYSSTPLCLVPFCPPSPQLLARDIPSPVDRPRPAGKAMKEMVTMESHSQSLKLCPQPAQAAAMNGQLNLVKTLVKKAEGGW